MPGVGWDTPRLRHRPTLLSTPAPPQPRHPPAPPVHPLAKLDHNTLHNNAAAGPSTPWHQASPVNSPPTTTSTIRYLRLAFQETPPKLKELEEGWRIARRAASQPGPVERVVVIERARDARGSEHLGKGQPSTRKSERSERRASTERLPERSTDRRTSAERHPTRQGEWRVTAQSQDDRQERRAISERRLSEGRGTERRRLSGHDPTDARTRRRDTDNLLRPPGEPPVDRRRAMGKGKQRAVPPQPAQGEEHSVGQSTGLLTPPASPHPGDAQLKPNKPAPARSIMKATPRLPVRFVSPPPAASSSSVPEDTPPTGATRGSSESAPPASTQSSSASPVSSPLSVRPHPPVAISQATPMETHEPSLDERRVSSPVELRAPRPAAPPSSPPPHPPPVPHQTRPSSLKPIRVKPLPLTRQPEPLGRRSSDTIAVHAPGSDIALTLNLYKQVARISRRGDEVTIEGRAPQVLRLSDSASWTNAQKDLWLLLARLVDEYKRRTARIKVFTQLGDLVVTCCEPPDIVLSFLHTSDVATTKVRLRYSLSTFEAIVDTSSRRPRGTRDETHRARRSIPLRWDGGEERAALALGVDFADWDAVEKDAVRRLWSVRDDWARFVPGYDH